MSLKSVVSRNVRQLRRGAGLTQEVLAAKAKLNPAYVARLEREPQNVTLDVLERLAKALKCTVGDIVGEQPRIGQPSDSWASDLDDAIKLAEKAFQAVVILKNLRAKASGK